jgi:hypothetical protein
LHYLPRQSKESGTSFIKYKTSVTPKIDNIFIFIYVSTIFQSSSG